MNQCPTGPFRMNVHQCVNNTRMSATTAIYPCHGFSVIAGVIDTSKKFYLQWQRHRWTIITGDNDTLDIAVLVWSCFGGLGDLWSGCVRCLWMCLFMAVPMTHRWPSSTSAAGDIAVLVQTIFGGLNDLWSGLVSVDAPFHGGCKWYHRRPRPTLAAGDIAVFSLPHPCSCHSKQSSPVLLILVRNNRKPEIYRRCQQDRQKTVHRCQQHRS